MNLGPLPEALDQFAADDVEAALVERLKNAGYPPAQAEAKVRGLLMQFLHAYGLPEDVSAG